MLHRWTSAALCVLFAIWFISGLAMAYQVSPVVSEAQRLQFAQPLMNGLAVRSPAEISSIREQWPGAESLRIGLWNGRPLYRWLTSEQGWQAAWADTGETATFTADVLTPEVQRWFGNGTAFRYVGPFREHSQWSYFAAARDHYPLHKFSTGGVGAEDAFFSSRTGEPVVATTWTTRAMYYLGPGLHYFSFYPIRNDPALWEGLVNWSSGIGALTCVLGLIVGVWHLRWRAFGTQRRAIPYVKTWMRWHHITGLAFGVVTFTFVLSGLFSMNPGGIFSGTAVPAPVNAAYRGTPPPIETLPSPTAILVDPAVAEARELTWHRLQGHPFVLARWDVAREQVVRPTDGGLHSREAFADGELLEALRTAVHVPFAQVDRLVSFDDHYYARKSRHLPLPVLRVQLRDEAATWYYLDPDTGGLLLSSDRSSRLRRWLYNGLHSFDPQWLLRAGVWWDLTIWVVSLCGLALSVTGVVVTWQWIERTLPRAWRARRAAASP